jgi:choline dehydrogenase-like flavoprotein
MNASMQLSQEFPFVQDMNSGQPLGIGWLQSTVNTDRRSSSYNAYLAVGLKYHKNLDVLIKHRVTRLLRTDTNGIVPVFKRVELAINSTCKFHVNGTTSPPDTFNSSKVRI